MTDAHSYTVAEVAQRLKPHADDQEQYRVRRWLQNQTNVGLLRPLAARHGGRGVHRRYAEDEVYKAAVLLALADIQLPGSQLEMVADWIDDMLTRHDPNFLRSTGGRRRHSAKIGASLDNQRRIWNEAKKSGAAYLAISPLEKGQFHLGLNTVPEAQSDDRLTVIVNLGRIFADVR